VPVALIGRQAVDEHFQGQGLGSILWADACRNVANAGTALIVMGIVDKAKMSLLRVFIGISPCLGGLDRVLLPASAYRI